MKYFCEIILFAANEILSSVSMFFFFFFIFTEVKKYAAVRLGAVEVLEAVHSALQGLIHNNHYSTSPDSYP